MPVRYLLTIFLFFVLVLTIKAEKKYSVQSPDGNILYSISSEKKSLYYTVQYKGKTIIDKSFLSLLLKEANFTDNIKISGVKTASGIENYSLVTGKAKNISDPYNQLTVAVQQVKTPGQRFTVVIKVFNGGLAFRYELPDQKDHHSFTLLQENSTFNIAGNPQLRALLFGNYTSSHEGIYAKKLLQDLRVDTLIDMPALFEFSNGDFLAVTEASLVDYAGMYLSKLPNSNTLISKLSPWPADTAVKVQSTLPHNSPWRVLLISDKIGDLIESNIITSLNEPCKIENTSWLKPGKTTFPWWNGNVVPDTINAPGNNFVTAKYYIDFCARNNIQYHSVVEYGLHQWYVDDGIGFQPGPGADVTKPVPGLDMKEICDYAHSVGVGVRVWVHWAALYPKLDTAFALFEKWGLSGMMVDFMDRDDQQMVNIQNEILQKAAKHHLHIQFHGAYKPTGLHRTWPNEFTREGTLNYEANKWAAYVTPVMDIDIPFTRMLAGSTDYHLGGFRAVPENEIKPNYTRPLMLGTRCHMLAMYVVLENYLQMVCDYPEAYEGQPGFEFIKNIPTTWDKTKVLDARPGEYIVIARQNGNNWYIGAITGNQQRNIKISFSFLDEGNFNGVIYSDVSMDHPNQLNIQQMRINKKSNIELKLLSGGGTVLQLNKSNN